MPLQQVLEFVFGVQWWIYATSGVYGLLWLLIKDCYKDDSTSWKRINGWLIQDTWGKRYHDFLTGVLDRVDRFLTPEIANNNWQPLERRSAWSLRLLNLSLALALAYPLLSLLVPWIATGEPGKIGILEILPQTVDRSTRLYLALFYLASAVFYSLSIKSNSKFRLLLFIFGTFFLFWTPFLMPDTIISLSLALAFAVPVSFAFAVAGADAGKIRTAIVSLIAVTIAVSAAFSVESALVVSIAFAIAFGIAVKFSLTATVAVAIAGAGAVSISVALAGIFEVENAFTAAGAGALFCQLIFIRFSNNGSRLKTTLLIFLLALLASTILAVTLGAPPSNSERAEVARSWILFLGFLPMLNALADFASTGLTRYCLRQGLQGSAWKWAIYDLLGAAAIFLALVLSLMAVAEWVRWPGGIALIDLVGTLADIRANPHDYWWLYITFLSTLLPTALHASVAIISLGLTWFAPLRRFIVGGLKAGSEGDSTWGMLAVWVLSLCLTVSVMIPVLLIGEGIPALPWIGFGLLSMFEWIAGLMAMV